MVKSEAPEQQEPFFVILRIGTGPRRTSQRLDGNRSWKEALQHGPLHLLLGTRTPLVTRLHRIPNKAPLAVCRKQQGSVAGPSEKTSDAGFVQDGSCVSGLSSLPVEHLPNGPIQNHPNPDRPASATCGPDLEDSKGMLCPFRSNAHLTGFGGTPHR